jgi:hypothetical protein
LSLAVPSGWQVRLHRLRYDDIHMAEELRCMDIVIPNATSIGVFSVAAILLLLTPGPAVLYIVARSVEQGRIAGLASVCGITTGTLVHVTGGGTGAVSAAGLLSAGLRGRQICGRRLSNLYRSAADSQPD